MIRKARLKDADQISRLIKINHQTQINDRSGGFLRFRRSSKKVRKIIEKSLVSLVFVKNNKIIGFMNAYPVKKKTKKKINWHNKKAEKLYFNSKKSAIAYLAVIHPDHHHQGVGTKLFNQITGDLRRLKYQYLFASVSLKPVPNKASLAFLNKHGFKKVSQSIFIKKL